MNKNCITSLPSRIRWSQRGKALRCLSTDTTKREPVVPFYPLGDKKPVPLHIVKPPYASDGVVPYSLFPNQILLHDEPMIERMRKAARVARNVLDYACSLAKPGVETDEIDTAVHEEIIRQGAYPSPLNYHGFPKSLCSSINEVICHGLSLIHI